MPSFKAKKVSASLLKKGFTREEKHHHYYEFWYDGKLVAKTYSSHSNEDIDDYLLSAMRKQCNMNKDFFIEFIKCTKSREEYIQLLIDQNIISKG
jgi:predicted RNA binding protein YcfA (HicA-like mRNA interferase family)